MRCFFIIVFMLTASFQSFAAEQNKNSIKAGFAKVKITPPVGTAMTGFGPRDYDPSGSKGIHDDLYARAVYISQGGKQLLIMGFDLLFFSREEADRFKGAIGRKMDILPGNILLNTSHTHTGPKVGSWDYTPSDALYLNFVENAIVNAALEAKKSARSVTIWAGSGTSELPMNRRKKLESGIVDFAPNPKGPTCKSLPVCLFKGMDGKPVAVLFSVSCHPSTIKGDDRAYWISADYPGSAMSKLDKYFGKDCSMFLQGAAGDAKASVIGKGEEHWRSGTWDDVDKAGAMVSKEVISVVESGLKKYTPDLKTCSFEMEFPMSEPIDKTTLESIMANPKAHSESEPEAMKRWAEDQLNMMKKGYERPKTVPVTAQGIKLADGLRIIGIEGEIVAELGMLINNFYKNGVTFALGYSNGAQLYIPTSAMIDEGGYEVESYWEYHFPAPLKKGIEDVLKDALVKFKKNGIN